MRATPRGLIRAMAPAVALTLLISTAAGAEWREWKETKRVRQVSREKVMELVEGAKGPVIVDARSAREYAEGHVPGAINVPHKETWGRLEELRRYKDRGIIYYCARGGRASVAANALITEGFRKVGVLEGHMHMWKQLHPVERSARESASD